MLRLEQRCLYLRENFSVSPDLLGETTGTSSSVRCVRCRGKPLWQQAMFRISSPRLSKAATEFFEPKTKESSTKCLSNQEKPCSLKSSNLTGIFLYASHQSCFEKIAPGPDSSREKLNCRGLDIVTFLDE